MSELEEKSVYCLAALLTKLKVAGFKRRSVNALLPNSNNIGKLVIRMAIMSLSADYLVLVPYRQADEHFKRIYVNF